MKKIYQTARVEMVRFNTKEMMIPSSISSEPFSAPKRNWVPGPGPSYDPQGSVV